MINGEQLAQLDRFYGEIDTAQSTAIFLTLLSAYTENLFVDSEIRKQLRESIERPTERDTPSFNEMIRDAQIFFDKILFDSQMKTSQLFIDEQIKLSDSPRRTLAQLDNEGLSQDNESIKEVNSALHELTLQLAIRNDYAKWNAHMQYFQDPKSAESCDLPEIFIGVPSIVECMKSMRVASGSSSYKISKAFRELTRYYDLIVAKDFTPESYRDELYIKGYKQAEYDDKSIDESDVFLHDIMFDEQILAFSPKALLAALRTLHAHIIISQHEAPVLIEKLHVGRDFVIVNELQVFKRGEPLKLGGQLLRLFAAFAKANDHTLTREQIEIALNTGRSTTYGPKEIQSRISTLNKILGKAKDGANYIRESDTAIDTYELFS